MVCNQMQRRRRFKGAKIITWDAAPAMARKSAAPAMPKPLWPLGERSRTGTQAPALAWNRAYRCARRVTVAKAWRR
jgi:hypothetical protein